MTNTTIPSIPVIPMDAEVDLIARVEAARNAKGTSPFVGIATPRGTLMLRRDVLKKSLAGLRVIEAELVEGKEGTITGDLRFYDGRTSYRAKLALRVYAVGERVKAVRLYIHQPWKLGAGVMHPLLESWQRANMRKWGVCDCHDFSRRKTCSHVETATRPKPNKWEKAIAKLQKEMPREWRPGNPAVPKCDSRPASDAKRRQWHEWKLQHPVRREIMRLARAKGTTAQMYAGINKLTIAEYVMVNQDEWLAKVNGESGAGEFVARYELRTGQPVKCKKWSEFGAQAKRKHSNDLFEYIKVIWRYCGLAGKPHREDWEDDRKHWGAEHYQSWLKDLWERRQLISQIAAIRAEMPGAKIDITTHKDDFDVAADGTVTNKVTDNSTNEKENQP